MDRNKFTKDICPEFQLILRCVLTQGEHTESKIYVNREQEIEWQREKQHQTQYVLQSLVSFNYDQESTFDLQKALYSQFVDLAIEMRSSLKERMCTLVMFHQVASTKCLYAIPAHQVKRNRTDSFELNEAKTKMGNLNKTKIKEKRN